MTYAEMDLLGAIAVIGSLLFVSAGVLTAWIADHFRRPGRLNTPFGLEGRPTNYDFDSLRRSTPLTSRKRR